MGQNSLVVGKNAGNFADSAAFCKHPSRIYLRIQCFADEFPTRRRREFFRARREFFRRAGNPQGIWREIDPLVPAYPYEPKCISAVDKKSTEPMQIIGFTSFPRFVE